MVAFKGLQGIFVEHKPRVPSLRIPSSSPSYRFADKSFETICKITIALLTPKSTAPILVKTDIVSAVTPAHLGMEVLDRESLIADTVSNHLIKSALILSHVGSEQYAYECFMLMYRAKNLIMFLYT